MYTVSLIGGKVQKRKTHTLSSLLSPNIMKVGDGRSLFQAAFLTWRGVI
jgi:hypothetical protein